MGKRCFIEDFCTEKDKENDPATFFKVPKHRLEEWRGILPKMGLLDSSRLSWRHFYEDDIIKGKFILGKFYTQQQWRLRDGATPKHMESWDFKMLICHRVINFRSDIKEAAEQRLTDHVLVLVFRPFRHKYIQPIVWFVSKGAANQQVLSEIILKAI